MVAVPASTTGSKRVRRYFKDREAALAYIISVKQQGFLTVEGQGTSSSSTVTLGECVALWIARHQQARMTFFQIRQVLNPLVARHGLATPSTLSLIENSTRGCDRCRTSSATTRHNYHRVTRRFFGWCQDFLEAIPRNPMKRVPEIRREHQDPAILTPEQMRACLEAADGERRLLECLALGGFAGLRTEEVLRHQWSDIDWAAGARVGGRSN